MYSLRSRSRTCFTLTILTCVLGQGLVESFNIDLSQAVDQIRKAVPIKAPEPYQHDVIRSRSRSSHLTPAYVRQFQQSLDLDTPKTVTNSERQQGLLSSFLLHGAPMAQWPSKDSRKLSAPFKWAPCGSSQQIMDVVSFSVKPDPIKFPGTISFSFNIEFHETISSSENVTVALDVYMKSQGKWLEIPCLGPVGSCTYVDFCQLIAGNTCPPKFAQEGVPCKCPFNKGQYKLEDFAIEIDAEVLLADDYKAKFQVSSDKKGNIGCYEVYLTVG